MIMIKSFFRLNVKRTMTAIQIRTFIRHKHMFWQTTVQTFQWYMDFCDLKHLVQIL